MAPASSKLKALAHVNADKAPLYRAVMSAFVVAKTRFVLHLRPGDVVDALAESAAPEAVEDGVVDAALTQLCQWGNLERHPDTAEVTTVEDFYRQRFLYQLTPAGEAAERAVEVFFETLQQPGELKTAALSDVQALLEELLHLAESEELDDGKVHRTLLALRERFSELVSRAQTFLGSLQRTIDLHGIEVDDFLAYKEMLIEYLERFLGELVLATGNVAETLHRVEEKGVERLLAVAARRDLVDALDPTDEDRERALSSWRQRWRGLRGWFVGEGRASQAEILRARARAAIPALLAAVASLHDRRTTKSDRTSDLRALARWFAEADSDRDAHRLWRAAFGLAPARHLTIDADTLEARDAEPVAARTSWLDAPPLQVSPRLRKTGRYKRRGRSEKVVDRGREKRMLAELAAAEAEQAAAARERLATGQTLRLSEIGRLERDPFSLFLDLLGEALTIRTGPGPAEATSSDGSLHISLVPTGDGVEAVIETEAGFLRGPDHFITVRELFGTAGAATGSSAFEAPSTVETPPAPPPGSPPETVTTEVAP